MRLRGYKLGILLTVFLIIATSYGCSSNRSRAARYREFFAPRSDTDWQSREERSDDNSPKRNNDSSPRTEVSLFTQTGGASYYGDKFHGKSTASGELYDRNKLTAAHLTLPFGSICRITNLKNEKSVEVRINDRGPHVSGRIVDLSYKAMEQIDGLQDGVINVKLEQIK